MLDRSNIQQIGFHNVVDKYGKVWGFQFAVATHLYRGMFLSMFRTGKVTVDGVAYPKSSLVWNIHGIDYTADEMYSLNETYWQVNVPAYVKVPKPGGLAVGYHDVEIEMGWVNSYGFTQEKELDGSGLGNGGPGFMGGGVKRRLLLVW